MTAASHHCQECDAPLRQLMSEWGLKRCQICGGEFCSKHIYTKIDGNNAWLTLNAPRLCKRCFVAHYGSTA